MRAIVFAAALIAVASPALAAEGSVHNSSDAAVVVVDNGAQVCRIEPGKSCSWNLPDGLHTVSATRSSDGLCFGGAFDVPNNVPNTVFGPQGVDITFDPAKPQEVSLWEAC